LAGGGEKFMRQKQRQGGHKEKENRPGGESYQGENVPENHSGERVRQRELAQGQLAKLISKGGDDSENPRQTG